MVKRGWKRGRGASDEKNSLVGGGMWFPAGRDCNCGRGKKKKKKGGLMGSCSGKGKEKNPYPWEGLNRKKGGVAAGPWRLEKK